MKQLIKLTLLLLPMLLTACVGGTGTSSNPPPTVPVLQSISISVANTSIFVGESEQLTATGNYSNGTESNLTQEVTWQANNNNVSITQAPFTAGIMIGEAVGNVEVVATYKSMTSSNQLNITVTPPASLQSIVVSSPELVVYLGESMQLNATGAYSDGTTRNITNKVNWVSSNESVAVISNAGILQASNEYAGNFIVDVNYQSVNSNNESMTVIPPGTLVSISQPSVINVGNCQVPYQLTATGTYSNGNTYNITGLVTWPSVVSSNDEGMGISSGGVIDYIPPYDYGYFIQSSYGGITSTGTTMNTYVCM